MAMWAGARHLATLFLNDAMTQWGKHVCLLKKKHRHSGPLLRTHRIVREEQARKTQQSTTGVQMYSGSINECILLMEGILILFVMVGA